MSGALDQGEGGQQDGSGVDPQDVERLARSIGWRPKEEFKGDPERWTTAEQFVELMNERPKVALMRINTLSSRMERMQRDHTQEIAGMTSKLDEAVGTIQTLTGMARTAEQRAYERARREIKADQEKAVADGDTSRFRQLSTDLDNLEETKPKEPAQQEQRATPPAPKPPGQQEQPPEIREFFSRNPWYHNDRELQREADMIHIGLQATAPNMPISENLAEVERRIKRDFPDRFGGARRQQTNGQGDDDQDGGQRRNGRANDDDEPRASSPMVTPSSGGAPRQQRGQRFTFDAMPKDSKDAYEKYKKQLEGKGAPLAKDEWADLYWEKDKQEAGV